MSTVTADLPIDVPPELMEAWDRYPDIVKYGHPVLREVAKPVKRISSETSALIQKMESVMRTASGLGLAAPQVGASLRIIVYDAHEGDGLRVLKHTTGLGLSIVQRLTVLQSVQTILGCLDLTRETGRCPGA